MRIIIVGCAPFLAGAKRQKAFITLGSTLNAFRAGQQNPVAPLLAPPPLPPPPKKERKPRRSSATVSALVKRLIDKDPTLVGDELKSAKSGLDRRDTNIRLISVPLASMRTAAAATAVPAAAAAAAAVEEQTHPVSAASPGPSPSPELAAAAAMEEVKESAEAVVGGITRSPDIAAGLGRCATPLISGAAVGELVVPSLVRFPSVDMTAAQPEANADAMTTQDLEDFQGPDVQPSPEIEQAVESASSSVAAAPSMQDDADESKEAAPSPLIQPKPTAAVRRRAGLPCHRECGPRLRSIAITSQTLQPRLLRLTLIPSRGGVSNS